MIVDLGTEIYVNFIFSNAFMKQVGAVLEYGPTSYVCISRVIFITSGSHTVHIRSLSHLHIYAALIRLHSWHYPILKDFYQL